MVEVIPTGDETYNLKISIVELGIYFHVGHNNVQRWGLQKIAGGDILEIEPAPGNEDLKCGGWHTFQSVRLIKASSDEVWD